MAITIHGSVAEACTQWTQMREREGGQKGTNEREKNGGIGEGNKEKRWQKERDIISCRYYNEVIPQRL